MLTSAFSIADPDVQEYLNYRADPNGTTWFEHCYAQGWTVEDMMGGYERWKAERDTIDHKHSSPQVRQASERLPHALTN